MNGRCQIEGPNFKRRRIAGATSEAPGIAALVYVHFTDLSTDIYVYAYVYDLGR